METLTRSAISRAVALIDSNRGAGALQMSSPVKAGVVVLAAGSGTARLARRVGAEIPQQLVSQTVILTDPVRAVTRASWPACRLDEDRVTKKGGETRRTR